MLQNKSYEGKKNSGSHLKPKVSSPRKDLAGTKWGPGTHGPLFGSYHCCVVNNLIECLEVRFLLRQSVLLRSVPDHLNFANAPKRR